MTGANGQQRTSEDGYVRFCLTAIVFLLAVVAAMLWTGGAWSLTATGWAAPADSGIPDAGAQRIALVKGLEANGEKIDETNKKLEKIITLLESGKVKVTLEGGGEKAGNAEKSK